MPFFSPLRKSSHASLTPAISVDLGNSDEPPQHRKVTEPALSLPRPWKRKTSSTGTRSSSSLPMEPTLPKVESSAADAVEREVPAPMPLPAVPGVFVTNLTMISPTEMIPATRPVPELLSETWDKVKDGPKVDTSSLGRGLDVLGANETFSGPARFLTLVSR
jgi:hypothetical protein